MLWKILTESWDCETPHPPTRWDKIPTFSENLKWEAPLFILSKTINAEKVLNLKSLHDEIFGFCLIHCDCGRANVYFFIFCVFVSCHCFYCLPKSSHADKFRLLSPAGCGSCGQLVACHSANLINCLDPTMQ